MGRAKKFFKKVGNFVTNQFVVTKRGNGEDNVIDGKNLIKNKLYGEGGDDTLKAFGARNELYGGSGDDYLRAIGVSNKMRGDSGDDELVGLGLHNDMDGGTGHDLLRGAGAYNDMRGGDGHDELIGVGAYNAMNGGADNDLVVGIGAYNDMKGGDGADRLVGIGAFNRMDGGDGDDVIVAVGAVNHIHGGDGDDLITSVGGANIIYGDSGDDTIVAGGISNVVYGGAGDDVMVSIGGANIMEGGSGNDIMVAAALLATVQDGGSGNDVMIAASNAANIQKGGSGNDTMVALSGGLNVQHGGTGDDIMVAGGAGNVQHGDDGNDVMVGIGLGNYQHGGKGDDVIVGLGAGNYQYGDDGDDIMVGIGYYGNIQRGGSGDDIIFGLGQANLQLGEDGDDIMVALGQFNVQIGGGGDDIAFALGQASLQLGSSGDDILVAAGELNIQHGGADNDIMVAIGKGNLQMGSSGSDIMIGLGKGNIQFGGDILDAVPADLGLNQQTQTDLDAHTEDGQANTDTNIMIAAGKGNLQFGDAGTDIAIALGEGNGQLLGQGNDVGIALGKKGSVQFGEDGKDVLVNMQFAKNGGTFQSGGGDNDTMITFFGGANKTPLGVQMGNSGNDIMAMVSQDFYKELFSQKKPSSSEAKPPAKTTAPGVTFQSAGSGDDTFIDLATGITLRSGGSGNDTFFSLGKGGIAFGGDGNDLMVGGMNASSFYAGGAGDDVLLDKSAFFSLMLAKHLINPGMAFAQKMMSNVVEEIMERVQFIIDGVDGVFNGIEEFLAAIDLHFPGIALPDIAFSFNFDLGLGKLAKLLDALNLDIPLDVVLADLQASLAEIFANAVDLLDTDIVDSVLGAIAETVGGLIDQVTTAAMDMAKVAEIAFEGLIDAMLGGVALVVDGVDGVITGIEDIAAYLASGIDGALEDILDALTITLPDLSIDFGFDFDFLPNFNLLDHIGDFAGAILDAIKSFDFTAGLDFVDHVTSAIGSVLKDIANALSFDGLRDVLDMLGDGIADGIDGIAAFFEDFPDFGAILDVIAGAIPDLGGVPDLIGKFMPEGLQDLTDKLLTLNSLREGDNLLGGDGNDTLGIGGQKTEAFGGQGDDTYLVGMDGIQFTMISDEVYDSDIMEVLDVAGSAVTAFDGGDAGLVSSAGGADVIEMRSLTGVMPQQVTITRVPDDIPLFGGSVIVNFYAAHTALASAIKLKNLFKFKDDVTSFEDKAKAIAAKLGAVAKGAKTLFLTNMDEAETRIETLRLVSLTGSTTEIDLAGALDAGVFSAIPTLAAASELDPFVTQNNAAAEFRGDLFDSVEGGTETIRDAVRDLFNDIKDTGQEILGTGSKLESVEIEEAPDHTEYEEEYDQDATAEDFLTEEELAAKDERGDFDAGTHAEDAGIEVPPPPPALTVLVNERDVKTVEVTQTLALADGTFMVLWSADEHSGPHKIHAQRMDASGQKIGGEIVLSTDTVSLHQWEAIALGNNEFALRADTYKDGEHLFRAEPNGTIKKLADPADGTYFQNYVKTVTLMNGGEVRIDNIRHASDEGAAAAKIKHMDGSQTTAVGKFADSNHMRQGDIVALADGGFVVSYTHTHGDRDIWIKIFNEDGSHRTGYKTPAVNATSKTEHTEPHLAALADGSFLLAYNKDEGTDEIRVLHMRANGQQVGEELVFTGGRAHPSIAANQDGVVAITYETPGQVFTAFKTFDFDFNGTSANDLFQGGKGDDAIDGRNGDDALFGKDGDDKLRGENGHDYLEGGAGNDTLEGGAGHDILVGGAGNDMLTGGGGDDIFVFAGASGAVFGTDTVTDFTSGKDVLDLLSLPEIKSFDDLFLSQDGADVLISTSGGVIRLEDTQVEDIQESDVVHSGNTVGEYGLIQLDDEVQSISTLQNYENPVVIAFVKTLNGLDIVEARISNVSSNGFDIRLQETEDLDRDHVVETVQYMVVEAGRHELANGAVIEAGTVSTNAVVQSTRQVTPAEVTFEGAMSGAETRVLASVNTTSGHEFVTARVDDVTETGFKVSMAERESDSGGHRTESIGFVAFQDGDFGDFESGMIALSDERQSVPDTLDFAQITDIGDFDPAVVRQDTETGEVFVQEDLSRDSETAHGVDEVSFLVLQQDEGLFLI